MQTQKEKMQIGSRIKCIGENFLLGLKTAIFLSGAVCFMLFLYAPIETYFLNKNEFWYDVYILVPIMFVVFVIAFIICILAFKILYLINSKLYSGCIVLGFITFICTWIQGNYLVKNLPVIDGTEIDWSLYTKGRIESIVLWIAVSVLTFIILKIIHLEKFKKFVTVVSGCLMLFFSVTLVLLCVTNNGLERKDNICVTMDNILDMSEDKNFIIFLLDSVDGQAFSEVIEDNPEYKEVFNDFTYYNNTMSAYPHTLYNIPYILSGKWFESKTTKEEYFDDVLNNSELFSELENRSYNMGMYELDVNIDSNTMSRFDNVKLYEKEVSSNITFARWQILLTGLRYAPFDLKRFSFVNPMAFTKLRVAPEGSMAFHGDNLEFYNFINTHDVFHRQEKQFKFIHIWGAHTPFEYDKDLNYIGKGTYQQSIEASITITKNYLNLLKNSDVYDNSVIIVMADHGDDAYYSTINYSQNPILLIKGINEEHDFMISDRPVAFADLQDAYVKLLDGSKGYQVFADLPDQRSRRF